MAAIKIHADSAETADYAGIGEWAKLDLQSIQHRDYFGHLSIYNVNFNPHIFFNFSTGTGLNYHTMPTPWPSY